MTHAAALALAPTFIKGALVTLCALVLFVGSVYLLVAAIFGLRMGYFVIATSFFAWMIILSALWAFGFYSQGPGTPKYLGPRGTEAHWQVFAASTGSAPTETFPETGRYPGGGWFVPAKSSVGASAIPTVTTAFQDYLASEAQIQLDKQGGPSDVELDPSTFVVQNVRFLEAKDGTHLAAATAFLSSGGPAITVFAYHDSGNVQIWSFAFLFASLLGFAVHVPFLDRAERSRKAVLTGGTAPAWYGPA
jgi:hypothetical protein